MDQRQTLVCCTFEKGETLDILADVLHPCHPLGRFRRMRPVAEAGEPNHSHLRKRVWDHCLIRGGVCLVIKTVTFPDNCEGSRAHFGMDVSLVVFSAILGHRDDYFGIISVGLDQMLNKFNQSTALEGLDCLPKSIIGFVRRSEEHTSDLQSLMRISYAVFCLKKKILKS